MATGPTPRTSTRLLARLRQDATDQAAWGEFVRRYGGPIYRWCRKWHLQEADAEDVTQTVLVKLSERMRTFTYDPARSFRAYLKTLARYAWYDLTAGQKRSGAVGDSDVWTVLHQQEAGADLIERLNEAFDLEVLHEAGKGVQQRVEPRVWEAFHLTAVEGLSGAEAAGRLGMKVLAVYKAKSRVQAMLQEEVARLERP